MTIPENFAISNLVIFGGVAATILLNIKDKERLNPNNPLLWVASIYTFGVIMLLIYGYLNSEQCMKLGYSAILFATTLLMIILLCFILPPLLIRLINLCKVITRQTE